MSKNLKYCHVVNKITEGMKLALDEVPRRGGMYNWIFLWKGDLTPYTLLEDPEKYDVIQVNLAPLDQPLIMELAKKLKNSSTLLIGNNDYVAEYWDKHGQHPLTYNHVQEACDGVFGTEPHQVSHMIDGAYTIPHPHWIKMLKHIGNDDNQYKNITKIGSLYHWWEGKTYSQWLLVEKLRKKYPNIMSRLYGYGFMTQGDNMKQWQRGMWDKIMDMMNYPDFIRSLQTNKFIIEGCSYHTYGRTSVDTAALGIPTMGTNRVFSMNLLWKNMVCDPFDIKKQYEIANKIMTNDRWLQEQLDYAYEQCEFFNYKNSKDRYLKMYDDIKERCMK